MDNLLKRSALPLVTGIVAGLVWPGGIARADAPGVRRRCQHRWAGDVTHPFCYWSAVWMCFSKMTRLPAVRESQRIPTMSYPRRTARMSMGRCRLPHSRRIIS